MSKSGFLVLLLLINSAIFMQSAIAERPYWEDGYWILDAVDRNSGGRDDVSTIWNDVSDNSVAGKTSWKWDTMDCSQSIVSTFSWNAMPALIEFGKNYSLNARIEQLENSNCVGVSSTIKLYYGYPSDITKSPLGLSNDGPYVTFGTGDGLSGEESITFRGPQYDERGFAILALCSLYQDWYAIQYRYKWVAGAVPPAYTKPGDGVDPALMLSDAPGISTKPSTSQIETGAASERSPDYAASPLGAEYEIRDYATCKDVIEKDPVGRTDEFSNKDARVYQWINIVPQYRSHKVENKWYSPDGRLYYLGQSKSDDVRNDEGWKFWSWIAIKGRDAENLPGQWKVDTYIDGHYVLSQPFMIIPASQQATILVDSRDQGFMSDLPQGNPI